MNTENISQRPIKLLETMKNRKILYFPFILIYFSILLHFIFSMKFSIDVYEGAHIETLTIVFTVLAALICLYIGIKSREYFNAVILKYKGIGRSFFSFLCKNYGLRVMFIMVLGLIFLVYNELDVASGEVWHVEDKISRWELTILISPLTLYIIYFLFRYPRVFILFSIAIVDDSKNIIEEHLELIAMALIFNGVLDMAFYEKK